MSARIGEPDPWVFGRDQLGSEPGSAEAGEPGAPGRPRAESGAHHDDPVHAGTGAR
ncbi:hypothetical protein Asi03nite_15360 [Actinoplanes siamensis]|uniref:Uncharacterized protein n=1 Tax=Actinoplanes siamensis TaxID=1223317 RepID=A0A919TIL1_9ACTN|nr:hypothetical protein Asi03nite_15360 [Actinoplanes siamensis]